MERGKATEHFIKSLASLALLSLFIWGMGEAPFLPSLRLLQDTQWDPSLFFPMWGHRLLSFLWIIPTGLGFLGWSRWAQKLLFPKIESNIARLLGLSLSLALFSLFVFGLAVNEILYWYLTALFFVPAVVEGWNEWKGLSFRGIGPGKNLWIPLWFVAVLLWAAEYLSAPLAWDAVLDHFRYAREVSRLHQIPFHWTNHTGDMPKAAELVLAGFWNMGGESLSKLACALPVLLTAWLLMVFVPDKKEKSREASWIFWTCPFFMALYAFGYIEGFLAFFEVLALYCLWKGVDEPKKTTWLPLAAFFFGTAFSIKYTAALGLGAAGALFIYEKWIKRVPLRVGWIPWLAFVLPVFPWFFKNWLAFGNPFYPLATSIFGAPVGYSPEMERGLLADTGVPWGHSWLQLPKTLWESFFTPFNQVNAVWTPLVVMSLPWFAGVFKNRLGRFLFSFSFLFLGGWLLVSSSFRHASGGALVLVLLAAMAWQEAFKEKGGWGKPLFGTGLLLSLWFCLSTQLTTTAPYASALGLEDPLLRLKRHYSYDTDTYRAYQGIENHSDPKDKVVAFAVHQTYPLNRIAFVDFKWKRPIFLQWASKCQKAEQLASILRKEGVRYFLYQAWEAKDMAHEEKDFNLEGMPVSEYMRFWQIFMEPVARYENSFVYEVLTTPLSVPRKLDQLPGLQEKNDWQPRLKGG